VVKVVALNVEIVVMKVVDKDVKVNVQVVQEHAILVVQDIAYILVKMDVLLIVLLVVMGQRHLEHILK